MSTCCNKCNLTDRKVDLTDGILVMDSNCLRVGLQVVCKVLSKEGFS